ncbi:MAG: type II secretion system GspH family protein [Phycisphaerae bacterium]|nr:type II secretion system GspH family protein [Phycisphaerae bacterium]
MTNSTRARPMRRCRCRAAMILLEVVIALGIMLLSFAAVGGALRNGTFAAERAERVLRAMMMTEELLTKLDTGVLLPEQEQSGEFGDLVMPGMSWKLEIQPDDQEPDLLLVTATIYEELPTGTEGERRALLETHTLRAKPRTINLKNDFGMTDEQLEMLTSAIPGGGQFLDPENCDLTSLAKLDMDTLTELLPALLALMNSGQLSGELGGEPPGMGRDSRGGTRSGGPSSDRNSFGGDSRRGGSSTGPGR